jgi:predicted ATP-grasp superfamily ATP-dependent carboligase
MGRQMPPVVLGSHVNAYGLVRGLADRGIRAILASSIIGPAMFSKYVEKRWLLPKPSPGPRAIEMLLRLAGQLPSRPLLLPTDEAWVLATLDRREEFQARFRLPFGETGPIRLSLTKQEMNDWCVAHGFRVPLTLCFLPGQDWQQFIVSARQHLPVIVKPVTKGVQDHSLGFFYRRFDHMDQILAWGRQQGPSGPRCPVLYQKIVCGGPEKLLSCQGYRTADGRLYMTGYTKLRQTPPANGCASAALLTCDQETAGSTTYLLERLGFVGFFDVEFKRDEQTGLLYFIELNPRPGMLNYGAVAMGVNLAWLSFADAHMLPLPPSKTVIRSDKLWINTIVDLSLHVVVYRLRGRGIGLLRWFRSVSCMTLVDAYMSLRDPVVFAAAFLQHLWLLLGRIGCCARQLVRAVFRRGVVRKIWGNGATGTM